MKKKILLFCLSVLSMNIAWADDIACPSSVTCTGTSCEATDSNDQAIWNSVSSAVAAGVSSDCAAAKFVEPDEIYPPKGIGYCTYTVSGSKVTLQTKNTVYLGSGPWEGHPEDGYTYECGDGGEYSCACRFSSTPSTNPAPKKKQQ